MHRRLDQIALEEPHERERVLFAPRLQMALPREPHRALVDASHDEEHEERRQDADPQHHAPAHVAAVIHDGIDELKHERRQEKPHRVPALHHARRRAAQVRRPVLERERHARGPHAAHADAEERADREEHPVRRREAAEEREQRVPQNGKHQRAFAAPAIGRGAGADAAGDAEDQRDRAEQARERGIHREAPPDVDEQERDDREIESVEHPPHVGAGECLPLRGGDFAIPDAFRTRFGVEG